MLVMSVVQQAFWKTECPQDGRVWGDKATLGYIARQLGMHAEGSTRLIKASLERLATAKVQLKISPEHAPAGYRPNSRGEVVFGFLAGYGWREASKKGVRTDKTNYIQLDPMLAEMIRAGSYTFLKAEVLRELRDKPLALKLYAWARTHRPNDRGQLHPYGVMLLASRLGCADTNTTRRRRKVRQAAEAVCKAAPDEFPGYEWREGKADQVITLRRRVPQARLVGPKS
jgi:hypothetical protein